MFGVADPSCICPTAVDLLTAEMHDVELALCEVHQADEIAARKLQADAANLGAAIDSVRALHTSAPPSASHVPLGGDGIAGLITAVFGVAPDQGRP